MEYLANAFPALLIMAGLFAVLAIGGLSLTRLSLRAGASRSS